MKTAIVVHPSFDVIWPYAADHLRSVVERTTEVAFTRLPDGDPPALADTIEDRAGTRRLMSLGVPLSEGDLDALPALEEVFVTDGYEEGDAADLLAERDLRHLTHPSEGFWGQSVSEFALGLTIGALRRIPQTHAAITSDLSSWDRPQKQFSDDPAFTSGTVAGKRVRIVGAGNIASRYAAFATMLGADVAAWDPFATEPSFHRAGARREWYLPQLVADAEIFAPMVPLTRATRGLVTAELIDALPAGCLVVLATRARVCDMDALRRRVLADELALAADVFDVEPLPLDDPLLGRHNVVHTPHNAGRTRDANLSWAEILAEQLPEYGSGR